MKEFCYKIGMRMKFSKGYFMGFVLSEKGEKGVWDGSYVTSIALKDVEAVIISLANEKMIIYISK
jgi:hypothetical protein